MTIEFVFNYLFSKFPNFPHKNYVIDNNWARGANTHCIKIFHKLSNIIYENDFLKK
jgi:hypothetical protein